MEIEIGEIVTLMEEVEAMIEAEDIKNQIVVTAEIGKEQNIQREVKARLTRGVNLIRKKDKDPERIGKGPLLHQARSRNQIQNLDRELGLEVYKRIIKLMKIIMIMAKEMNLNKKMEENKASRVLLRSKNEYVICLKKKKNIFNLTNLKFKIFKKNIYIYILNNRKKKNI